MYRRRKLTHLRRSCRAETEVASVHHSSPQTEPLRRPTLDIKRIGGVRYRPEKARKIASPGGCLSKSRQLSEGVISLRVDAIESPLFPRLSDAKHL